MKTTTIRVPLTKYRALASLSRRTGITIVYLVAQAIDELVERMTPKEEPCAATAPETTKTPT
jgi:predicted DNA-binding protein